MIAEILAVQPVWKIKNRYQVDIPEKYLNESNKFRVFNLAADIPENDPSFNNNVGEVNFNSSTKLFKCVTDNLTIYVFYGPNAKAEADAEQKKCNF